MSGDVELISPSYLAQVRAMHAARTWGDGGHAYALDVLALLRLFGGRTILDYGCGRGTLRRALPGYLVQEFDPGIAGKDSPPAPADIVVCSDVLEHVEPDRIGAVLDHLWGVTGKAALVVISTRLAKAILPDGRNAHLIVQTAKWWLTQLRNKEWTAHLLGRDEDQIVVLLVR